MKHYLFILFSILIAFPAVAAEQEYIMPTEEGGGAISTRLDRLEKTVNLMQRQLYTSSSSNNSGAGGSVDTDAFAVQLKGLRGDIEQLQYQVATLNEKVLKLSNELEVSKQHKLDGSAPRAADTPIEQPLSSSPGLPNKDANPNSVSTSQGKQTVEEEYQAAYAFLKNKDLPRAESALQTFIKQHPKHKLVGSAHYWLGEVYALQSDHEKAVVEYLKGYQASPTGPKAPDSLLKLGLSLSKINKTHEACVTFAKLRKEFPKASETISSRTTAEMKKLRCE